MKIISSLFLALALVGSAFAQSQESYMGSPGASNSVAASTTGGVRSWIPMTSEVVFLIPGNSIVTSGAPADMQSFALPSYINRYTVTGVWAYTSAASGTLALATIDLRTAAAGGGSSLLTAPVALTGLTAVNLAQNLTPLALGATFAGGTMYARQTVNSANAATLVIAVRVLIFN